MIDETNRDLIERLDGYLIPLTMPLTSSREVDLGGLAENTIRATELPGSTGVYFGSVYQEFWTLSMDERKQTMETVAKSLHEAENPMPLVAGVSSTGLTYTLELAEHAEAVGAEMVMVWPPMFGDRDEQSVYDFYREIAHTVNTPMCVYSSTLAEIGYYVTPRLLARLVELPNVCAVKEASFSLSAHLDLVRELGDRLAISSPFEEYWLAGKALVPDRAAGFLMGSSRAMYMQTPEQPLMGNCLELVRAGKLAEAYASLEAARPLIDGIQMRSFGSGKHPIALVKWVTEQLGWAGGPVRAPIPDASEADRAAALESLRLAGLVGAG